MKIVITGADEFVGASFCRYFEALDHEIIALGEKQNPHPIIEGYAGYIKVNILEPIQVFDADICIHAAGLISVTDNYKSLILSNVEGTLNVVEAAKNCKYIIHISSSSVYEFTNTPAKESDASIDANLSNYGETKLLAEEIINFEIPVNQKRLILRPRAIYGNDNQIAISGFLNFVYKAIFFCPIKKRVITSLTHVDNIADAIKLFLEQVDAPELQIFNITDDRPYYLRKLMINILSEVTQKRLKVIQLPVVSFKLLSILNTKLNQFKKLNPLIVNSLQINSILDISKIKQELNYKPSRYFYNFLSEKSY